MGGFLIILLALLLVGLFTYGAFVLVSRMTTDVIWRVAVTIIVFGLLLYIADRTVGIF